MKMPVKRLVAINDLSGFGRAALSAVIPIVSSMGIQVCSVPTAILSTHTGGFEGYTFVDLTDNMSAYLKHWRSLEIGFDAIYTGFLGSEKQIELIAQFIDSFEQKPLTVIDPVMADNGKLYSTMDYKMVEAMRAFIAHGDLITPNITEAAFLLGEDQGKICLDDDCIKDWLLRLSAMGPKIVVITSVPNVKDDKKTNVVAYDREANRFWKVECVYIPTQYPGTGDAFTSALVGSLMQGDSLPMALDRSVQFVTAAIRASYGYDYPNREGVLIEKVLDNLKLPVIVNSFEMF